MWLNDVKLHPWTLVSALLFCVAGSFAATPYSGIVTDARLYVLQGLRWLDPAGFARDLWFTFGSQDDYTIYSPYLAVFLRVFGLAEGAMLAAAVNLTIFAAASLALGISVLGFRRGILAGLALASIPLPLGPEGFLRIAEGLATPRTLAVAASMVGLACAFHRRPVGTLAFSAVAMLLHPIMALGPSCVAAFLLIPRARIRWALLGGSGVAGTVFLGGTLGLMPLMSQQWLEYVRGTPLVFIDTWIEASWPALSVYFGLVLAGALFADPGRRRFYGIVATAGALGLAVSWLAAHVPIVQLLQTQPWRAVWLVQVVAVIAAVDLTWALLADDRSGQRPQRAFLLAIGVWAVASSPWLAIPVVLFAGAVGQLILTRLARATADRRRWLNGLTVIIALWSAVPFYFKAVQLGIAVTPGPVRNEVAVGLLRSGGFGLLAVGAWWLLMTFPPWLAAAAASMAMVLGLALWDLRPAAQVDRENTYSSGTAAADGALLRPGATVYWKDHVERVWFLLGRSSYASAAHASGLVFSEPRAVLLAERLQRVRIAYSNPPDCSRSPGSAAVPSIDASERPAVPEPRLAARESAISGELTEAGLVHLCGDPALDYVVGNLAPAGPQRIAATAFLDVSAFQRRHVYNCAALRANPPTCQTAP